MKFVLNTTSRTSARHKMEKLSAAVTETCKLGNDDTFSVLILIINDFLGVTPEISSTDPSSCSFPEW